MTPTTGLGRTYTIECDARAPENAAHTKAISEGLAMLAAGHPPRAAANAMRRAGVAFNVAWRVILIPSARRAA